MSAIDLSVKPTYCEKEGYLVQIVVEPVELEEDEKDSGLELASVLMLTLAEAEGLIQELKIARDACLNSYAK